VAGGAEKSTAHRAVGFSLTHTSITHQSTHETNRNWEHENEEKATTDSPSWQPEDLPNNDTEPCFSWMFNFPYHGVFKFAVGKLDVSTQEASAISIQPQKQPRRPKERTQF